PVHYAEKNSPPTPGHLHRAVLVYALAANGSQTGEGYIQGQVQQVPGQSQNRGPGNSTGDG
uniref:single-stranded DNA-binding protein n=1 Tax=Klebsiella pneumoniae TaxID=573 RepID=UPI001C8D8DE0